MNIIWLKRDLRLSDHLPLDFCEKNNKNYFFIYIFEPSIIEYPDTSLRHLQFIYHSILLMNKELKKFNRKISIYYGESDKIFNYIIKHNNIDGIYSYQESGTLITYKRDLYLKKIFKKNKICWTEYQRDGIIRGIKNRLGWDQNWFSTMNTPISNTQISISTSTDKLKCKFPMNLALQDKLKNYPHSYKKPGETEAKKTLISFADSRGFNYSKYISKPNESRKSCGRISPYLAWGNISVKQAYQYIKNHQNYKYNKRSFNGLLTRLKWRCHFIQKFEVEPEIEKACANRGFESLKKTNDPKLIQSWEDGITGIPLVDANMRCLIKTGWINFRMRAMLVSIFCHQFDCDWRKGAHHLARLFLDYEPGIHYSQFQMQAGTTGINAVRIYNPIKQSYDHDEEGIFIKKWVEELKHHSKEDVHEPWGVSPILKNIYYKNCKYPNPVLDLKKASTKARKKIWDHKKSSQVFNDNYRILKLHTRNN
tara:strand:+ start:1817 stop:3256 length:1440 start_codon:yes stop_codon:yes gene_type:complete